MSDSKSELFASWMYAAAEVVFLAIKFGGHSLADWSWLWIVCLFVPLVALIVQRLGL